MSIKLNLFANYLSQFYIGVIGVVLIPVYIGLIGIEAYGLVGFFATIQSLFVVLDLGLSSTAIKEVTKFRGGKSDLREFRLTLRSIEIIFWGISLSSMLVLVLSAKYLTTDWLEFNELAFEEVYYSVILIAFSAGTRWCVAFYKGVHTGYEEIVFLSKFNAIFATFRFVLVIPFLQYVSSSPVAFFIFQGMVACIELIYIIYKSYTLIPKEESIGWSVSSVCGIGKVLKFSVSVSVISLLWVFISQYDKTVLSGWMGLSDYGVYMMLVLAASIITYFTSGLYNVLLPRLSVLHAEDELSEMKSVYKKYTQFILIMIVPISATVFFFSDRVLKLWAGVEYDTDVFNTLSFLALGNMFVPLLAFPYMVQYAYSDFKIAIFGNFIVASIIPFGVYVMFLHLGVYGVSINWSVIMFLHFMITSMLVHNKFFGVFHLKWMLKDVMPISITVYVLAYILSIVIIDVDDKALMFVSLFACYLLLVFLSILVSSEFREIVVDKIKLKLKPI